MWFFSSGLDLTAFRNLFTALMANASRSSARCLSWSSSRFLSARSTFLASNCRFLSESAVLLASSSRFLSATTAAKATKLITPNASTAAVLVTSVRCRRIHRRARTCNGSCKADTGSSASQRSVSARIASAESYRSLGSSASALRQIASKAGAIRGLSVRGRGMSFASTFRSSSPISSASQGAWPVSK